MIDLTTIQRIGGEAYVYCTDFTINLANLTHTSYYEINFILFCVLYPLLLVTLPTIAIILKMKLNRLKKHKSRTVCDDA
jgi:hypothetical protein